MVRRVYGWTGYDYGKKTVFIWGAAVVRQPFFKKTKHDLDEWLKGRKIYNTFYFNSETMAKYLNQINRYKPQYIVAYVTPLYNFARFIKENKKEIEKPVAIITAAEKLFDTQRKLLEEVFQCPVFETYGCREVTSIAGECKEHNGMHINMETIYLEIVRGYEEAQVGQSGEIVITDLSNYAMPFIRYKNEDIGSLSDRQCQCGRGLSLLEKVEGRVLDTIKTEDGRLIPGEFFIYWFMRFDGIERFQIVQEDLYHLHIKIVQHKKFPLERLEYLKKVICDIMGNKINIHFDLVEEIPLTQSGKFRVVISKVPIDFEAGV